MRDFDKEIANHEQAIADLKQEKAALMEQTPAQQLAVAIHDIDCRWNHTDGCGWLYEIHKGVADWTGYAHARYLLKAKKLMEMLPEYGHIDILNIVAAIKGI